MKKQQPRLKVMYFISELGYYNANWKRIVERIFENISPEKRKKYERRATNYKLGRSSKQQGCRKQESMSWGCSIMSEEVHSGLTRRM